MAWIIKEGTYSHVQLPLPSIPLLIVVLLPLTHANLSWLSRTVLELPQLESSVEKVSLNQAAIWADLGGRGYEGRDTFACPTPVLLNPTSDRDSFATDARTIKHALWNHPLLTTARMQCEESEPQSSNHCG